MILRKIIVQVVVELVQYIIGISNINKLNYYQAESRVLKGITIGTDILAKINQT